MSTSGICSDPGVGKRLALLLLLCLPGFFPREAGAQVLLSQQEALRLAFPSATRIERRTAYLSEKQLQAARQLAGRGVPVEGGVVTYYVGLRGAAPLGVAYFDVHRVRTLPEVAMVVVAPDERVERVEILKFAEPPQYKAPEGWIDQLEGRALDARLSLKGGVPNMTGATLTSAALVNASRRVLALHRVIQPFAAPAAAGGR